MPKTSETTSAVKKTKAPKSKIRQSEANSTSDKPLLIADGINPQLEHATATEVLPHSFDSERHYYTRVLNATIHPMVSFFMRMSTERLISRYCHLRPRVDKDALDSIINYQPKFLRWAGADLFHVTTAEGAKRMLLVETNSCPSGQKSMPLLSEHQEQGGYHYLLEQTFKPAVNAHRFREGALAVIYDKNFMEASGYAATMAEVFDEPVYLAPFFNNETDPPVRFVDNVLQLRTADRGWIPIRAALRYVTQTPWNRIPISSKTLLLNPILGCLAGGRNKLVASMAYDLLNAELSGSGLSIHTPETLRDVSKEEIPFAIKQFGGHAAIKVPYSNAGQGVFTITNPRELDEFLARDFLYEKFIVQSLIGNYHWSSQGKLGKFYHVGTVPNRHCEIFVADIRMMVSSTAEGFRPLAIYGRRARLPLLDTITGNESSWDMLGTNLSVSTGVNQWDSETNRLLLVDRKDFNTLGVSLDNLIHGYIQTLLATVAIDKMAANLITAKGQFRKKLFFSVNSDQVLLKEIIP